MLIAQPLEYNPHFQDAPKAKSKPTDWRVLHRLKILRSHTHEVPVRDVNVALVVDHLPEPEPVVYLEAKPLITDEEILRKRKDWEAFLKRERRDPLGRV